MSSGKNFLIFKFLLRIFLIWAVILILISLIGLSFFPNYQPGSEALQPPGNYGDYAHRWATWDGGHFRGIAETGYKKSQTAFFPFYPLLIRSGMLLGINSLYVAIFISVISGLVGLFFLYKLLLLDFSDKTVKRIIFLLLIYPTSFILLTAYSEGLFFVLSTSALYFARTKKWQLAYILAGLSSITRLIGVAVIIAVFVEKLAGNSKNFSIKKTVKPFLLFCLSFIPLGLYSFYLNLSGKGYLSFLMDELYWGRRPTLFWDTVINSINSIGSNLKFADIHNFLSLANISFFIFLLVLFIAFYKKIRKSYRVYYLLSVIIPLSSGTLTGIQRYSLVVFPVFIVLSLIKNKLLTFTWIFFSAILLATFLILYINGFPID